MRKIQQLLFNLVILVSFTGCNLEEENKTLIPEGKSALLLTNAKVLEVAFGEKTPSFTIKADTFNVELRTEENGEGEVIGKVNELVKDEKYIEPGTYFVNINSNNFQKVGFNIPYYSGTTEALIFKENDLMNVEIMAELQNIPINLIYSAETKNTFDKRTTTIITNSGESLVYDNELDTEDLLGYFAKTEAPYIAKVKLHNSVSNQSYTTSFMIDGEKTDYEFKINANTELSENNQGALKGIEISISDAMEQVDITWTIKHEKVDIFTPDFSTFGSFASTDLPTDQASFDEEYTVQFEGFTIYSKYGNRGYNNKGEFVEGNKSIWQFGPKMSVGEHQTTSGVPGFKMQPFFVNVDDWLITPEIDLTNYEEVEFEYLSIASGGSWNFNNNIEVYFTDTYDVADPSNLDNWVKIEDNNESQKVDGYASIWRTVDQELLKGFEGKKIRIAFRANPKLAEGTSPSGDYDENKKRIRYLSGIKLKGYEK